MLDLGIVRPGSTVYIPFASYGKTNGESITLTGLAVADIEVYKDGSTTQRASDNGYTLLDTDGIDFDGITGIHGVSISLADNSDAGFWAAGSSYTVVVSSVTIDGQTVNFVAATFRIGYPAALINTTIATLSTQTSFTLTNGPAEDDALNGMWVVIHDVASAVQCGYAVISDYTGSTKTVTLAAGTTFTAAAGDNIAIMGPAPLQPTVAGRAALVAADGSVSPNWADVKSPSTTVNLSGTTVKTATDVETDTADIQSRLPAALVSGRMDASVGAMASNTLTAAALAADAVTEIQSGLSTLDAAGVRTAVGLAAANLDTQLAAIDDYIDTEVAAIKAKTDNLPSDPADASDIAAAFVKVRKYLQLLARKDAAITTDNATELSELNADGGSGAGAFSNQTDGLEAIRDRGDAAWGSAGSAPQVLVDTTVATVNDQTHFELTAALGANDTYNNQTVVFYDASASDTPSVRKIIDFVDATNEIVVDSAPDFTVVAGDGVKIFVTPPGTTAPTAAENAATLLAATNTSSNDGTTVGGQLRRTHALVGGTKRSKDHSASNPTIVSRNEADTANLITQTRTVSGSTETITPS